MKKITRRSFMQASAVSAAAVAFAACSSSSDTSSTTTTTTTTTDAVVEDAAEEAVSFDPITMKLAHYATATHPGGVAAQQFADEIYENTNGDISVEVYPNNELGDPADILEQNIQGVVDMSLGTQGSLDKYSKKFATVMLPFVFDDYTHAYAVLDGPFYEWTKDEMLSQGLVLVGSWDYGFRNLTNNVRPVESVADVAGMNIRTPGEIQLQATMEALGANVQTIAFSELYLALKQNTVDGQENPLSVIYENSYFEAQAHLAMTNHVYNSMNLVISETVWNTLPAEYQDVITAASANAAAAMRGLTQDNESFYMTELENEGMAITYPDTAEFAAAMDPAYATINEYIGNDEYSVEFLAMVEDCR